MKREEILKLVKYIYLIRCINEVEYLNNLIQLEEEILKELDPPKILELKRKYYGLVLNY